MRKENDLQKTQKAGFKSRLQIINLNRQLNL